MVAASAPLSGMHQCHKTAAQQALRTHLLAAITRPVEEALCTQRLGLTVQGPLTDEDELKNYLKLTDAEFARVADQCHRQFDFVGNGVNKQSRSS
jgi:hypothetical protein